MKKGVLEIIAILILFSGCNGSPAPVSTQSAAAAVSGLTLDQAIAEAAVQIGEWVAAGTKIAPLNFNSSSDRFSVYVLDELTANLVDIRKFTVVDRSEIDLIRREFDFQYSGEVADDSMQTLGRMLGAQSIISGSLTDMGEYFRVMIRVLNVQSASVEVQYRSNIVTDPVVTALLGSAAAQQRLSAAISSQSTAAAILEGLLLIEGGTFIMGSPENEEGRWGGSEDQKQVTVSSFYIGKYEVTVREFRRFVNITGYITDVEKNGGTNIMTTIWEHKSDASWRSPYIVQEDNHPVVLISWNDAVNYCNWLSLREGLMPAYTIIGTDVIWNRNSNGFRLPTEAEWEYACRAGTTTAYNTGSEITTDQANFNSTIGNTTPVGNYAPNLWGLYDMHGNVWEWCWDWYGDSLRSRRGGSFGYVHSAIRSAYRDITMPSNWSQDIGFRLVRNV